MLAAALFPAAAADYYVAPNGTSSGSGSISSPMSLAKALSSSSSPARPGDTIWLRGGVYSGAFNCTLAGTASARITVRGYPGERAVLDAYPAAPTASATLAVNGRYTDFRDFEITNSEPTTRSNGPSGVDLYGPNNRLINLVIHDCCLNGIGAWMAAVDCEIYGCVMYRNGRRPGYAYHIYLQNGEGVKRVHNNIGWGASGFGIHGYTEGGQLRNFDFQGNTLFNNGTQSTHGEMIVGGTPPDEHIVFNNNYLYRALSTGRGGLRLGYSNQSNIDLTMRDNYIAGGSVAFNLFYWRAPVTVTGNTFCGSSQLAHVQMSSGVSPSSYTWNSNTYYSPRSDAAFGDQSRLMDWNTWRQTKGWDSNSTYTASLPTGTKVFIRPNAYEPGRANITVFNWAKTSTVSVNLSGVVAVGAPYQVKNVENFLGPAVASGTYGGGSITIPMSGGQSSPEFGAFVVLSSAPSSGGGDTQPPALASSSADSTGVVRVVFSEDVNKSDAETKANYTLESPTGTAISLAASSITLSYNNSDRTATLAGLSLTPGATYRVTVRNIRDTAGNRMTSSQASTGTVVDKTPADTTPPSVKSSSANSDGVVTVTFSEAVNSSDATRQWYFTLQSPTGTSVSLSNASFSYDEKTFTTTISGLTLKAGNSYRLTVRNIRDLKDNRMSSTQTVNGTVESTKPADTTPPTVKSSEAENTGVVRVVFSEAVNSNDAVAKANFTLESPTGTAISLSGSGITLSYDNNSCTTTIRGLTLTADATYKVTVRNVKDAAGNAIVANGTTNVSSGKVANTAPPPADTTPPSVKSSSANSDGVVTVTFSEAVNSSDATRRWYFTLQSPTGTSVSLSNASFSYDEKTFTTTISGLTLKAGNSYRLTVRNIRDLKDNRMPSTQTVNGTVEGEDEVTPPSVPTALAPADGATVSPTPAFKVKGTDPNGAQVKYVVEVTQGSTTRTYETALVASGAEALCKVPINQALSPGQISWRVKTVNASGAESTWSASRSASVPSSQPAMMGAAGVSTLGLSLQTGPISPAELGFTNAQIAQWDPATRKYLLNAEVQQVKPGVGYWVLASEPTALHFSGQPTKEPFPIQLIAGWNLISSPVMTPVVWDPLTIQVTKDGVTKSLVDATDAGWVEQYAFGWDSQAGKYVMVGDPSIPGAATQQLLPWRAYWVRARENCTLLLNPNGSIGSDSIVPPPPFRSRNRQSAKGAWGVRLQVQSNGGGAEVLLGMAGSGRAVTLGVPPLPPMKESAGTRAVLLGSQGPLSADLRTGAPSQEWEIEVQPDPTRSSDTVTLTWPDLSTLPKDVKLTLIDPATGARRYMRSTRAYSFRATDQPRRLRVVAEPRTSAPVMITEVSLVSTRANSRVVRFGLSASATVDVEVVSPSGQSVGTLARGRASDPGTNQVVWSGPARPGTYLLRITATNDEGASVRVVRPIVITR